MLVTHSSTVAHAIYECYSALQACSAFEQNHADLTIIFPPHSSFLTVNLSIPLLLKAENSKDSLFSEIKKKFTLSLP